MWVISTGAMLIGIPWALAFTEEAQMMEMEREMRMQNSANEVCGPWSFDVECVGKAVADRSLIQTLAPGATQQPLPGAPSGGRAPL